LRVPAAGVCEESVDGRASYRGCPHVLDGRGAASEGQPQCVLERPLLRKAEDQAGKKTVSGANPGFLRDDKGW